MPYRRRERRNPDDFTIDEAQTATLITAEGSFYCHRHKEYYYPEIQISMCVKEALEPASRVFGTSIIADRTRRVACPPELYPPDGRGVWRVLVTGTKAERIMEKLKPLIPKYHQQKWEQTLTQCARAGRPKKHYRPRKRQKKS